MQPFFLRVPSRLERLRSEPPGATGQLSTTPPNAYPAAKARRHFDERLQVTRLQPGVLQAATPCIPGFDERLQARKTSTHLVDYNKAWARAVHQPKA